MKLLVPLLLLTLANSLNAQTVQQKINEQVWKPFIAAFNSHDTEAFMAVHSKEVVRSPRDAKVVWNWQEYFNHQRKGDERDKSSGEKRLLELRFTERLANEDQAVEVGVYKTTSIIADGTTSVFFGRFHVVLRKENETWKIMVDTDSSEHNTITEKDFVAAAAME